MTCVFDFCLLNFDMISSKFFLLGAAFGFVLLLVCVFTLPDNRLHIVFCDVGQGDAAYIRMPGNRDMLIDGGPNDRVLTCLGRHMPFYDRTIDIVMATHPQNDHIKGLVSVLRRYRVGSIMMGAEGNDADIYRELRAVITEKHVMVRQLYRGDHFAVGRVNASLLWPDKPWVLANVSGAGQLDTNILGLSTTADLNDFSNYLHMSYGSFDALFTGDGDSHIQPELLSGDLPDVEVLKYPHHGAKTGMLPEFLGRIKPELTVISVGKNSYGHPSHEALELLAKQRSAVVRTDREGDIEVVSDGKRWWVR